MTKQLRSLLKAARERTRRRHGDDRVVVLAYVCEAQQRGVFHPHVVLGYRTAADRAALETFRDSLRRLRGEYGFGTGRRGSFDAGKPDRFSGSDAGRYISKYLRPDGAKASFVPLLEGVGAITPRDSETGRRKSLLRPVYVSPQLTRITGVTMGFLRFCRWVFMALKVEHTREELLVMYRAVGMLGAGIDGVCMPQRANPPPVPCSFPAKPLPVVGPPQLLRLF